MNIVNKTKDKVLAKDILIPQTLKEKSLGLLREESPRGMYVKTRWGLHTGGMNFAIDIIIADKNMKVRKILRNVGSGRIVFWSPLFNNVFELPAGTVKDTGTEFFDKIKLEKQS